MDKENLVSVVIPTYGEPIYLGRCIDSVLQQTYNNIEIIIVDDNGIGTPNQIATSTVIDQYKGNNIKYVCHEKNKNGSAARNTGVNNSEGRYIAFLDDDDAFLPAKIERQVKLIESLSDEYAFVYCSHDVYTDGQLVRHVIAEKSGNLFFEKISQQIEIQTSGVLIRKEAFEEVKGFDESFRRHQERVLFKYKAQADNFVGYIRYLYFRSVSINPGQAREWRNHYLSKMKPYIDTLSHNQARMVYSINSIDIVLLYLKAKDYGGFIKEVFTSKIGLRDLVQLIMRIIKAMLRGGPVRRE